MIKTPSTELRRRAYQLFEDNMQTSPLARFINTVLAALIILNVIAVIFESDPHLGQLYAKEFAIFEAFSVIVFTIEFALRVWCCVEQNTEDSSLKARVRYLFSPIALVDLLAIVPFYIALLVPVDLRYLRLLRVMRILKLTHHFKGFNIFITVLTKELKSIAAAILVMLFLIIIAASVMYTLENEAQPEVFGSIAQSLWWSVVTMTTVGYGDVTPITTAGKVVAMVVMLLGVGLVALPAGMLAGRFSDELKLRRRDLDNKIRAALLDGNINPNEQADINELAEKLELAPEDIAHSIRFYSGKTNHIICPHCHKPIDTNDK